MIATALRTTARRSALAALAALAATAALAASPAAHAADGRPHFQMPLPCGQTWAATTYATHNPDADSIDLVQRDDGDNISEGEAILAPADGTVTRNELTDPSNPPRAWVVYLDHGNDWTTRYYHLQSQPPLQIGQRIAQGERIGTVGRSGTESPHLHFTQLHKGEAVRIEFNGVPIDVHAGNQDATQKLTSSNCPGRAFLPFDQSGKHHLFAYTPGTGAAGIASIDSDAKGITNPWHTTANRRWTHFMPFTLDGDQRYISYKAATGEAHYDRIGTSGPSKLSGVTWGKGWTHLMPFSLGDKPYFVAYDQLTGAANVDRINDAGNNAATVQQSWWTRGWTQLVPFRLSGVPYMLAYRGSTGEVKVNKITGSGNNVTFSPVHQATWSTGWTHIVPIVHNGAVHLLRYSQSQGWASFDKVNAGGAGFTHFEYASWTRSWTTFSPFTLNGKGYVLMYKGHSGQTKIQRLDEDGHGVTTTAEFLQTLGLT